MDMQKRIAFLKELRTLLEKHGVELSVGQNDIMLGDPNTMDWTDLEEVYTTFFYDLNPAEIDKYIHKHEVYPEDIK